MKYGYIFLASLFLMALSGCDQTAKKERERIAYEEKIAQEKRNEIKLYYDSGLAGINAKDYDNAIADFTRVIEMDPKNAYTYYNRKNKKPN